MSNFGRVLEVLVAGQRFTLDRYTIEGEVPYDNDTLPNESEIKIWNLSQATINRIKRKEVLMVNAGYTGDVGLILHGWISDVYTIQDGVDKVTTIHVLDSEDTSNRGDVEIAYAPGTLGSYIIKDMARYLGLPVAQFELNQDIRYADGYTANGSPADVISEVAADCGTSAYVNKQKLYVRNLRRGMDEIFQLSPETGLIGSPEPFEDGASRGYRLKSQLQYRITTASVIDLTSRLFEGRLYARAGSHKFSNSGDFMTTAEAII